MSIDIFLQVLYPAQRSCKTKTQHQDHSPVGGDSPFGEYEANTKLTKIKNNNYFNLLLCPFWFLGVFVFEDFFYQKNEDCTCNTIGRPIRVWG
jgi:hypothetical protein